MFYFVALYNICSKVEVTTLYLLFNCVEQQNWRAKIKYLIIFKLSSNDKQTNNPQNKIKNNFNLYSFKIRLNFSLSLQKMLTGLLF